MTGYMKQELDKKVALTLGKLGYSRLQKRVFKAPWGSDEVEHFVYLDWSQKFGTRISIRIGICHRDAQIFAATMLRKFGPLPLRDLLDLSDVGKDGCFIQFHLGNLCSWPFTWSLDPFEMGMDAYVREITDCLQGKLLPLVGHINNDPTMYEFLTQMRVKALWPANGAVRAAEAIFIAKRLDYRQDKVMADIEPFEAYIASQIDRAMTVNDYLTQVWSMA